MASQNRPIDCDFGFSDHFCSRRDFLRRAGTGFGMLGLANLIAQEDARAATYVNPLNPRSPHYPGNAKAVIFLFMYGGPSGFDLFDYKPDLVKYDGKKFDWKGEIETFKPNPGPLMKSPYSFKQYGECGQWVSEVYPALAQKVDQIAFIKSVHCETNNHAPAMFKLNTGMTRVGHPSVGSWVTYGLGSENRDLPGFIVMYDPRGGPIAGPQNWGAGFLPNAFQGTPLRPSGTPILNLERRKGLRQDQQRAQLDLMAQLNEHHRQNHPEEADLIARIESYELAYRMQMEAPKVVDLSGETEETKKLYGMDQDISKYFGTQLLMARRMIESGVRFVQVYSGGGHQQTSWDAHNGLKENHDLHCAETDVPMAGLITDLERRGMLEETLIVWGGEFGRMPMAERTIGRDHNPEGFVMWMAGGGVKGGVSHGETDEVGYQAAVDPCTFNDIHATILHLMGLDHERLTYKHNGRRMRLTDVSGEVLTKILA